MNDLLLSTLREHKRGSTVGLYSICSAHTTVLEAAARLAVKIGAPLLVESTSNQVNQEGGYTGMTPAVFAAQLRLIASQAGLAEERVILGGDHLGPYPWRTLPASQAMEKACELVEACVLAGYTKLHLDTSIVCADDPWEALPKEVAAQRTAQLCAVAERAFEHLSSGRHALHYVIGTEVPRPGGEMSAIAEDITSPEDAAETISVTRQAFARHGLDTAWERVVAMVVQPGVEFSDNNVHDYEPVRAKALSRFIEDDPRLVYEAHSTDYQLPASLRRLVEDHFAILKVGPALTFAFREAIFALAWIEKELLGDHPGMSLSNLFATLEQAMLANPKFWVDYYRGEQNQAAFARRFSYSDRSRYYWGEPAVQSSLSHLFENLGRVKIPGTLLSQFMPEQYRRLREGRIGNQPKDWVIDHIQAVLRGYARACGYDSQ